MDVTVFSFTYPPPLALTEEEEIQQAMDDYLGSFLSPFFVLATSA